MSVRCKDCGPGGRARPAPFPGPRCATHHREVTRARKLAAHARRTETVYGITADGYAALLAAQGGVCAICRRATGRTKRLAVDHRHDTGEVRGILCGPCNQVLLGRYDAAALRRALDYLADPPAARVLGRTVIVPGHRR
jgi:hypothetical protein